ncbi:MAG: DNA-processing protein DprA [Ruthenibacterium lactatiformans]
MLSLPPTARLKASSSGRAWCSASIRWHPPQRGYFLQRNWLIAGLSRGLCVAEARRRSGTMNTVAAALAAGRDVFSVPGSIFSPLCEGTNQLLREGAVPAVSGADILLWYGLAQPEQPEKAKPDGAPLSLDAQRMRDAMSAAAPLPLDALCERWLPPPKAMAALTELSLGFSRQLQAGSSS